MLIWFERDVNMVRCHEDRLGRGRESISTTERIPWHILEKIDASLVLESVSAWSNCWIIVPFRKDSDVPDGGESDGAR